MGEQMINSFDGLSADFIAEKRHTSRDNDSSRGGDHGGSVSDEEGSTTLSAEHVPPVKVKFRTEYTQPAAPEAPAAPGSTTTGENTTVPSEGVIDFMAPGVGELPAAQPEVTPAPAAPIETTKLDLSGENDSATAGVREAAGQQFEAGTRQIDPEFMAVAQAAARERLAATETPVQAEAPAAQPEVTPAPAAPAEGSGITLTGEGNGPTAEATGNWFAQQAKEFNQNHPDFAASLNDQPEATTQTAEAPAEAVPPIPEQPAETTPNYGEQVVARIKDEFYHPEKRSEAAQTPEAEEGAQESAVVKAAEHLADAADSLDATVAKLQDVLDNEKAEKRKGPDREHAVRSLLEVSGQGDRPIDSAFEATALEVLRDLEHVTPEQLNALADYASDYYSQLYLELGTAGSDLEKQEILAQISAAAEMYSQILQWRAEANPEYDGPVTPHQEIEPFVGKTEEAEPAVKAAEESPEVNPNVANKTSEGAVKTPEKTTETETEPEAKLPEVKLAEIPGYEAVLEARDAYLKARFNRRKWFRRGSEAQLEETREAYENELAQFLVKATEHEAESLDQQERLEARMERLTSLELQEMRDRSEAEVQMERGKLSQKALGWFKKHPWIRATVGAGLLGISIFSGATGNIPFLAGSLALRSALNGVSTTVGAEGALTGLGDRRVAGLSRNATAEEIEGLRGAHVSEATSTLLARAIRRGQELGDLREKDLFDRLTSQRRLELQKELALELRQGKSAAEARANTLMSALRNTMRSEEAGQGRERHRSMRNWLVAGGLGVTAGVLTWVSGAGQLKPSGGQGVAEGARELHRHPGEIVKPRKIAEKYMEVADSNDGPEHMIRRAIKSYATKHGLHLTPQQLVRAGDDFAQHNLKGLSWKGHNLWVATGAKAEFTEHGYHLVSSNGVGGVFERSGSYGILDAIKAVQ